MMLFHYCTKCGTEKAYTEFSSNLRTKTGLSSWCKNCACLDTQKRYKNPLIREKMKQQAKNWMRSNRESNKEKEREKISSQPWYKAFLNVKSRGREILKIKCPIGLKCAEFKTYIESLFTPEMTWANYGKIWNICRIKNNADLLGTAQEKALQLNYYTNLIPKLF